MDLAPARLEKRFSGGIEMNRTTLSTLCVAGLALAAVACSGGNSAGPTVLSPTEFGQKFKFADNALPGWTQAKADVDPAAFNVYTSTDDLVARIDGAADAYAGFRVAVFQDFMTCNVVTMDFVTAAKASDKFTYQKDNGATTTIPGYDGTVATASTNLTGINVYAHFNALYFELQMSGYMDQSQNLDLNKATSAAAQFLAVLKTKSN
jgi:hypothetical protein